MCVGGDGRRGITAILGWYPTRNNAKIYMVNIVLCVLLAAHTASIAPNIVIILADDVGIGDIAAYDPTAPVPTPNIDALAAAGTLLHDAHAQVLCAPSRASLLAGRHPYNVEWNYGFGSSIKASIKITVRTISPRHLSNVVGKP